MLSLSVLLGPLPLQLCVPCTSPSLKLFLISVVLPSSGSYCILDPRSCHIFHCLVCSFPLLYLPGDLQMQNCSQLLSLTKCLPWSAGLSSPGFFWEMQTMGLHSRQTASPSALNFFLNWCVFSFLFSSRNFLSFFFFFFCWLWGMWDLSCLTRDQICTLWSRSTGLLGKSHCLHF